MTDDKRDQLADIMEKTIRVNRQEFFDSQSLYHKNVKSRRVDRTPLTVDPDNSFADLAEGYLLEQIKNRYSSSKLRAFVDSLFIKGVSRIETKDIQISGDSDFILLILAVIPHNDRDMPYTIEIGEGRILAPHLFDPYPDP